MKQKSIPVGCVPPNFLIPGRSLYRGPPDRDRRQRLLLTEIPLDRDSHDREPPLDKDPLDRYPQTETPQRNMGPETKTPLEATWGQAARQEVTSYRDPLPL